MVMMHCTAQLEGGRLKIGLPWSAFEHVIDDLKDHSDAKVWIPDPTVVEVRDLVVEFRLKREVQI